VLQLDFADYFFNLRNLRESARTSGPAGPAFASHADTNRFGGSAEALRKIDRAEAGAALFVPRPVRYRFPSSR